MNETNEPKCWWDVKFDEVICPKHGKPVLECPLQVQTIGSSLSVSSPFFRLDGNEPKEGGP